MAKLYNEFEITYIGSGNAFFTKEKVAASSKAVAIKMAYDKGEFIACNEIPYSIPRDDQPKWSASDFIPDNND